MLGSKSLLSFTFPLWNKLDSWLGAGWELAGSWLDSWLGACWGAGWELAGSVLGSVLGACWGAGWGAGWEHAGELAGNRPPRRLCMKSRRGWGLEVKSLGSKTDHLGNTRITTKRKDLENGFNCSYARFDLCYHRPPSQLRSSR